MKWLRWIGLLTASVITSSCLFGGPYTVGGTVTGLQGSGLVLQNSSGKYLDVTASGSFTFVSGLDDGAAYSVTVRTQPSNPTQTCTVVNATGTIDKADVTNVLVNCSQAGRFAYVANETANTISAYSIDSTTGALTPVIGSPFASSGASPVALTIDPNGVYLYAADYASNDVSVYAIDATTGVLTPSGELIATGNGPLAVSIDPTNQFLFVANSLDNTVSAYSITSGGGFATVIVGSPFLVGRDPSSLTVDPSGLHLYVTNFTDGSVSVLSIDSLSGALTDVSGSPVGAGVGALSIALDTTATYAYVANETSATLSSFAIDATTGILTSTGSPLATTSSPESIVVDPTASYVFAANVTAKNSIASYSATAGVLTLVATIGAGTLPLSLAIDPSGIFLYSVNSESNDVSAYTIDTSNGALTAVAGSPFLAGVGARAIAID